MLRLEEAWRMERGLGSESIHFGIQGTFPVLFLYGPLMEQRCLRDKGP